MTIMPAISTWADASRSRTYAEIRADLRARLIAKGFNPDTWSDSDYKTAILALVADVREGDEAKRVQIARGRFLDAFLDDSAPVASVDLDLLAAGFYQVERRPAKVATLQFRVRDTANIARAPFSSPLVAVWNPTDPDAALYFTAPAGILVPKNGFVDVEFTAERAGAAYNVSPDTVTTLTTPIPGIALESPAIDGLGTIVVSPGADEESNASLVQACKDRWSLLRRGWGAPTIRAILRDVIPEATRVFVRDDAPMPAECWVYLATAVGPVSNLRLQEAYDYFASEEIKPLSNRPLQFFTANVVAKLLQGTIWTDGTETALLLAQQRLNAYMFNYDLGRTIYREALEAVMRSPADGVQAASITSIVPELSSAYDEIVTFVFDMTVEIADVFK